MFYLTTHSTHFIYGYMVSNIWEQTTQISREETRCRQIGYSFRLAAMVLYMHHPTDRITHTIGFVHFSRGALAGTRTDDPSHHKRTLLPRSHISLPVNLTAMPTLLLNCKLLILIDISYLMTIFSQYSSGSRTLM